MVRIRFFGQTAEACGTQEQEWNLENGQTVKVLVEELERTYPDLQQLTYRVARNAGMVDEQALLKVGDEIALLPPFAGG
ncbi:MoaD/ThiS family protein [bacterium SCSIO 12741]|nr:MoaD/ThiS family protein [bacterium SCSIO 12741]